MITTAQAHAVKQAAHDMRTLAAQADKQGNSEAWAQFDILVDCLVCSNVEAVRMRLAHMPSYIRDQAVAYLPSFLCN